MKVKSLQRLLVLIVILCVSGSVLSGVLFVQESDHALFPLITLFTVCLGGWGVSVSFEINKRLTTVNHSTE